MATASCFVFVGAVQNPGGLPFQLQSLHVALISLRRLGVGGVFIAGSAPGEKRPFFRMRAGQRSIANTVTIDIDPAEPFSGWTSILHVTSAQDGWITERYPGIWFEAGGYLHVAHSRIDTIYYRITFLPINSNFARAY